MENLQEQIAKRAYELFQARGGQDGYHIQDWLKAEKDVMGASAPKAAAKVAPVAKAAPAAPVAAPKKVEAVAPEKDKKPAIVAKSKAEPVVAGKKPAGKR